MVSKLGEEMSVYLDFLKMPYVILMCSQGREPWTCFIKRPKPNNYYNVVTALKEIYPNQKKSIVENLQRQFSD